VLLPRPLALRSVLLGAVPFFPHFRRLSAHFAGTDQAPFFDYVLAHEHAIADTARRALAREAGAAEPVEALLGRVPG
jgi:hypothetical protein